MADSKPKKILIIDDETEVRFSIRSFLEDKDYEVIEADNGQSGLNLFRREKPDLVLIDLRMPGVDGLEVLANINEDYPDVPTIIVSGTGIISDAITTIHLGAWDYILKPITEMKVLHHSIKRAFEKVELIKENRQYQKHMVEMSKRRTAELEESEEILEEIINAIPDIIYRLNPQGEITFINAAVKKYGYDPETLIGKKLIDLVHPEDKPNANYPVMEKRTGIRRTQNFEIRIFGRGHKDNLFEVETNNIEREPIFLLESRGLYGSKIIKESTEFIGTQGVARDISDRRKKESRLKFQSILLDQIGEYIISTDLEGKVTYINSAGCNLFKMKREDIVGQFVELSKEDSPKYISQQQIISHTLEVGEWQGEIIRLNEDGSEVTLDYHSWIVKNLRDEPIGVCGVAKDITEQKLAEKALQESEMKFRHLFEQSKDAIYIRRGSKFLHVSPSFESMLGYLIEEVTSDDFDFNRIVAPEDLEIAMKHLYDFDSGNNPNYAKAFTAINKDGQRIETEVQLSHVIWDNEPAVMGQMRDTTEQSNLEIQLYQTSKMEAVGRLAGGLAHDFNNLLTSIIGNAELALLATSEDNRCYKDLKKIIDSAVRASTLTKELLTFSRQQKIEAIPLNINKLIENSQKILLSTIGEKIRFEFFPQDSIGLVKVDKSQLEQILVNLALNAYDAMPAGGRFIIKTSNIEIDEEFLSKHPLERSGSFVMITVSDTGIGMSPEVSQKIFEPFFTTKSQGKGTGLGLASVYGIIKQHDGFITVNSQEGIGSTFKIFLPRIDNPDLMQKYDLNADVESIPTGNESIFVVEDEDVVRDLAVRSLKHFGYNIRSARSPEVAMQILIDEEFKVDLLITDIIMPGLSGPDLASELLSVFPDLKVLYMSGYTEDTMPEYKLNKGATNFIPKPFHPLELARKVRNILDEKS